MAGWPARRWAVAAVSAVLVATVIAIPTALVANPLFTRMTAPTWWSWPVLVATATLGGLVAATYVRMPGNESSAGGLGTAGGLLSWLAVGCPVCNKLVVLAMGVTGAMQWWAPFQPVLAVASLALLAVSLLRRLRGEVACSIAAARA
jgi:hypothetical protein